MPPRPDPLLPAKIVRIARQLLPGNAWPHGPVVEREAMEGLYLFEGTIGGLALGLGVSDFRVGGGGLGPDSGTRLARFARLLRETGRPLVLALESIGARYDLGPRGVPPLVDAIRELARLARGPGIVTLVKGPCHGIAAVVAGMGTTILAGSRACVSLAGPRLVQAATGQRVDAQTLGGIELLSERTTLAALRAPDWTQGAALVRELASLRGWPALAPDAVREPSGSLAELASSPTYTMQALVDGVLDGGTFRPWFSEIARGVLVGSGRLSGLAVGVVATDPSVRGGALGAAEVRKLVRFLDLWRATRLPLVSFVDTPGFLPTRHENADGIVEAIARLVDAIEGHPSPSVALVVGKCYGAAGLLCMPAGLKRDAAVWVVEGVRTGLMDADRMQSLIRHQPGMRSRAAAARAFGPGWVEHLIDETLVSGRVPLESARKTLARHLRRTSAR